MEDLCLDVFMQFMEIILKQSKLSKVETWYFCILFRFFQLIYKDPLQYFKTYLKQRKFFFFLHYISIDCII